MLPSCAGSLHPAGAAGRDRPRHILPAAGDSDDDYDNVNDMYQVIVMTTFVPPRKKRSAGIFGM